MQSMNDKMQDKDEKIDQMNSKLEILVDENNKLKESYEKLLIKLNFIQDNNILIPKDGGKRNTIKSNNEEG